MLITFVPVSKVYNGLIDILAKFKVSLTDHAISKLTKTDVKAEDFSIGQNFESV